jgi:hypothetical protein
MGAGEVVATFLILSHVVLSALQDCSFFDIYANMSEYPYLYGQDVDVYLSFSAARSYCSSIHPDADLVIVRDLQTLEAISDDFLTKMDYTYMGWVGLRQTSTILEPNGNWFWLDGVPAGGHYLSWQTFELDDIDSVENCGSIYDVSTDPVPIVTYWDDDCTVDWNFVCEINGNW